jgi:hypothetical protein
VTITVESRGIDEDDSAIVSYTLAWLTEQMKNETKERAKALLVQKLGKRAVGIKLEVTVEIHAVK